MNHRLTIVIASSALLGLVAAGCARPPEPLRTSAENFVRIPHGPQLLVPKNLFPKIEGEVLRLTPSATETEQCAVELTARDETNPVQALEKEYQSNLPITHDGALLTMPLPPGNAERLVLARSFGAQTVLLSFCIGNPSMNETELRGLLLNNLR